MKLIIRVIGQFVMTLINLLLLPINTIIETYLPGLTSALQSLSNLLEWLKDFAAWFISWLPFSSDFYTFFYSVVFFTLFVPLVLSAIKVVVKWWHALVP